MRSDVKSGRRGLIIGAIGALSLCALVGIGFGQQPQEPARPSTLHEYFQPGNLRAKRAAEGDQPQRVTSRQPGEPPDLTLSMREDEPVLSDNGPVSDLPMENPQGELNPQDAANKLDDNTDRVDELNYFSTFDPSVIPLKRGVAQNQVILDASGDYAFVVDGGRQRARVGVDSEPKRADEDSFWGTFLINAAPNTPTPIASVAPQQRILKVLTEPRVDLQISRDKADNYYLTTTHRGLVRVNIMLAAPRFYFDGELSASARWGDFPKDLIAAMPPRAFEASGRVLDSLGISRATHSPREAMVRLIEHFRDFEGKPFPAELRGKDVYESIALNSIGVCRHRSFAFVMTASALGFPSRYVYNEAHAFVEVYWPGSGWRRVDLGGSAEDVLMRAGQQRQRVHDGAAKDTLPQPPAYTQELARMAEKDAKNNGGGSDQAGDASASTSPTQAQDPNAQSLDPNAPQPEQPPENFEPFDPQNPAASAPIPEDPRVSSALFLDLSAQSVRRGEDVRVSGRLRASGRSLANQEVRFVLVPVGASNTQDGARLLGQGVTDAQGSYDQLIQIPKSLPIGRWEIKAVYAGDKRYRATESP